MYVLDSSAIIEVINEGPAFKKVLATLKDESLVTTSICMHEVLVGAGSEAQRFVLEGIFSTMRILEHDKKAARIGAELEEELHHTNRRVKRPNVLIAAVCNAHNGTLVTFDTDFKNIKSLKSVVL
jgi:predicted nucleic acid-binding protein